MKGGGGGRGDTLGTMAAGWWCPPPWDGDAALDKDGDASLFAKATGMRRRFEGKKMGFGAGMGGREGERSEICCGMGGLQVSVPPTHGGAWGAQGWWMSPAAGSCWGGMGMQNSGGGGGDGEEAV